MKVVLLLSIGLKSRQGGSRRLAFVGLSTICFSIVSFFFFFFLNVEVVPTFIQTQYLKVRFTDLTDSHSVPHP